MPRRLVTHWQQTLALLELFWQSAISKHRYWVIPFTKEHTGIDNPYGPAANSVIEASELQDRDEWRAHTGDPVTQMNRNDFVGITQSSTSAIVQALYADFETTMATLRARLAPEENEEFCAKVAKLVKDCLPKEQRVLLVQLRFSHENKKHNTTLNQLREILNVVNQHNKKKPGQPYVVRPLGTHVAGEQSQKLPLTKADLRAYKKILLPGFDLFGSLDEIDKRTYPVMSRRSLIAEFWRQIADTGRARSWAGGAARSTSGRSWAFAARAGTSSWRHAITCASASHTRSWESLVASRAVSTRRRSLGSWRKSRRQCPGSRISSPAAASGRCIATRSAPN
jgi:uncharacterized protein (DUF2267 family)